MSERRTELEQSVFAVKREVGDREKQTKKLTMEVKSLTEKAKVLEEQIVSQEKHVKAAKPDEKKLAEMNSKVDAFRAEYEEAMENSR